MEVSEAHVDAVYMWALDGGDSSSGRLISWTITPHEPIVWECPRADPDMMTKRIEPTSGVQSIAGYFTDIENLYILFLNPLKTESESESLYEWRFTPLNSS
jgi:hypothetical protein